MKKSRYLGRWLLAVALIVVGCVVALPLYLNHAAERGAQDFCNSISINSDASDAVRKFAAAGGDEMHHLASTDVQGFIFPGFAFDKAECDLSVNKEGKVISHKSFMRDD